MRPSAGREEARPGAGAQCIHRHHPSLSSAPLRGHRARSGAGSQEEQHLQPGASIISCFRVKSQDSSLQGRKGWVVQRAMPSEPAVPRSRLAAENQAEDFWLLHGAPRKVHRAQPPTTHGTHTWCPHTAYTHTQHGHGPSTSQGQACWGSVLHCTFNLHLYDAKEPPWWHGEHTATPRQGAL